MPPPTRLVSWMNRPFSYIFSAKKATTNHTREDVQEHFRNKEVGFVGLRTPKDTLPILGTLIGIVGWIFGFKKDSSLLKWCGGILTAIGIGWTGLYSLGWIAEHKFRGIFKMLLGESDGKVRTGKEKFVYDLNRATNNLQSIFSAVYGWPSSDLAKRIKTMLSEFDQSQVKEWISQIIPPNDKLNTADTSFASEIKAAFCYLAAMNDEESLGEIISYLKDEGLKPNVRKLACEALVFKHLYFDKNPKIIQSIIEIINNKEYSKDKNSDNYHVRQGIVQEARWMDSPEVLKAITERIKDDSDDMDFRIKAIKDLTEYLSPKVVDELASILEDTSVNQDIRQNIINCFVDFVDSIGRFDYTEKAHANVKKIPAILRKLEQKGETVEVLNRRTVTSSELDLKIARWAKK